MRHRIALPDWNALAAADDGAIPLFGTALLIARDEYPELDPGLYDSLAQDHADALRDEVAAIDSAPLKMHAINRHLFAELRYSGNTAEYYDPRNSYLNEVFERRLGNPLTLALVQIEVARRLGVPLCGVSFPGHFLVRLTVGDAGVLVMDPFNGGRPLDVDELRDRAKPHLGGSSPDDNALNRILDPASNRAMLVRLLRNLHSVYSDADDWGRAARSADRILQLQPDHQEALRDRALAYLKMGHRHGARLDLERYLQRNPSAADQDSLRERLVELNRQPARPH